VFWVCVPEPGLHVSGTDHLDPINYLFEANVL
jgi:hypothetical protein